MNLFGTYVYLTDKELKIRTEETVINSAKDFIRGRLKTVDENSWVVIKKKGYLHEVMINGKEGTIFETEPYMNETSEPLNVIGVKVMGERKD